MKEQRSGSLFRVVMGMFTQIGPLLIYFAGGLFIIKAWDPSLGVGVITATVALINSLYRPVEAQSGDTLAIETLSSVYAVRRIAEADISDVYSLCRSNHRYYRSIGERPSRKRLTEVISELPESAASSGKYFVGFYKDDDLYAVLDLITGYPEKDDAFIGWFMVDANHHRTGIGSQLFADIRAALKAMGFDHLSLKCPKASEEAAAFWTNQGFTGHADDADEKSIVMERDI